MPSLAAPFTRALELEDSDGGPLLRAAIGLFLLVVAGAVSLRLTLRLAGPLAVLVVLVAASAPPAQAAPALTYACSPGPTDCLGWSRVPVDLSWDWDQLTASPSAGNCDPPIFSTDTPGTDTFCEVADMSGRTRITLTIRVDQTAPTVTGVTPDRPPDYNGWFNHPVGFAFQGADATSGVAACDSLAYGGPEGEGVVVPGACRDVAGNVATRGFPLNYDATVPAAPQLETTPGDNLVDLGWSLEGGAVSAEVARVEPGADEVLYSGTGREFVDRGLKNGVRHRYRVTAVDRAGNRAASETSAVPTASLLLNPTQNRRVRKPPLLEWKRRKGASYYNVQVFRRDRKILSRWPRTNHYRLRKTWRYGGRRRRLVPGRYVWYVWPGFGKRAARNYGRMLGKRTFVVVR